MRSSRRCAAQPDQVDDVLPPIAWPRASDQPLPTVHSRLSASRTPFHLGRSKVPSREDRALAPGMSTSVGAATHERDPYGVLVR